MLNFKTGAIIIKLNASVTNLNVPLWESTENIPLNWLNAAWTPHI
jgi:hypothetical protein